MGHKRSNSKAYAPAKARNSARNTECNTAVPFGRSGGLKLVPRSGTTVTTLATPTPLPGVTSTGFGKVYVDGTQIYYAVNGALNNSLVASELWRCIKPACSGQTRIASFTSGGIAQLNGDENTVYAAVGRQLVAITK